MIKVEYPFPKKGNFFEISDHLHDFDDVQSILTYSNIDPNKYPVISVVIPAYNADYLREAILSAINQDFDLDYELLIVDDLGRGNENTLPFLKTLKTPIIRYYRNTRNIGLFGNWNRCISLSRGRYIVYLHSDDCLIPTTLSTLWNTHLQLSEETAVIGRYITLDKNGHESFHYQKKQWGPIKTLDGYYVGKYGLLQNDLCNGCGSLINRECIIRLGGWNPDFYPGSDRILFMNYFDRYSIYRVNSVVRIESTAIATSSSVFRKYPASGYYKSKAIIERYFKIKWFWNWVNIQCYIVRSRTNYEWENNATKQPIPFYSKIVSKLFAYSYLLRDKTI